MTGTIPAAQPQTTSAGTGATCLRIVTAAGDILVALDDVRAPLACAAFRARAEGGTYAGGLFHRLVRSANDHGLPTIEVVQASCASGGEGEADVPLESTDATGLRHLDGVVSLPRGDAPLVSPFSFFICVGDQPALDAGGGRTADGRGFAAFARVTAGMDVVRRIHAAETLADAPIPYLEGQLAAQPVTIHGIQGEPATAADRLHRLCDDYWAFRLREFPQEATAAGVRGHNHRLEGVTPADHGRRQVEAAAMLARTDAIAPDDLDADAATTLMLLRGQLRGLVDAALLDEPFRPRLFPFGFADTPDVLAQSMPLDGHAERDDFHRRMEAIPAFLSGSLDLLTAGAERGYRVPRVLVPRVAAMLDGYLAPEGLRARVEGRLARDVPGQPAERSREQRAAILRTVETEVLPALAAVRDALLTLGPDALTDEIGLAAQPGGKDFYQLKIRQQTSLDLSPQDIHGIGLDEVARIRAELEATLVQMGRAGEMRAVAAELDARIAPDAETLLTRVRALAKRIDGLLPSIIGRMPSITYGVEPLSPAASVALPPALAQPSPANRSMPGIYWLTALPEKCPLHLLVPLTLHEAWPGHLMQLALANELAELPAFRRYGWTDYNGYVEGWALYCERLGYDLGLYDDPADRFGLFTFELWRAARLVVDTGIHALGWSRSAAIDYLGANTFLPQPTIESEVDRYIGLPAQALSYKLGERVIRSLRARAEARLGEAFTSRQFHDALLATGPVALTALEAYIERWIDRSVAA